jgi:lipid-A-disaccharide synthase
VHDIKRDVDKMLVILPFEQAFFEKYGMEVDYVGHPLLDALQEYAERNLAAAQQSNIIALLPGSRRQEVQRILPEMLAITKDFPDYQFIIAGATSLPESYYKSFLKDYPQVQLSIGGAYGLLQKAHAALVKSGTSTLETALFGVPQVVCYAGNSLSYHIARRLVQVKYISLVNLIMDKPLVRELIQHDLNSENLKHGLKEILEPEKRAEILAGYAALRHLLGDGGASERSAGAILEYLSH